MSEVTGREAAFSSLKVPEYRLLWWGGLFSFMAVQMQFLLRSLLAWDLTESESALGQVYLFFGLSMLVALPLGGVAADRLPKRLVLIVSQTILAIASSGMGIAVITGTEQFWMLLLAAIAQGGSFGFFGPARTAFTRELVGRAHLGNAISLTMLSMNGTRVFAPSLAGALAGVAFVGIGPTYLMSAAMSAISLVLMFRLPNRPAASTSKANPLTEIVDGVRYVAARPPIRRLVVSSMLVIMFGFNYVAFMPALVEGVFGLGEGSVGLMSTASAVGAVLVFIPVAARADSSQAKAIMIVSGFGFGVFVMLLGAAPNFWLAILATVGIGVMTNGYQSLSNTLALRMADEAHQGRVQSIMQLAFAGFGMMAFPLGVLAEEIGLRPTLAVMGAVALLAIVGYALLEHLAGEPIFGPVDMLDLEASVEATAHSRYPHGEPTVPASSDRPIDLGATEPAQPVAERAR